MTGFGGTRGVFSAILVISRCEIVLRVQSTLSMFLYRDTCGMAARTLAGWRVFGRFIGISPEALARWSCWSGWGRRAVIH